jgi:hypothetical protein
MCSSDSYDLKKDMLSKILSSPSTQIEVMRGVGFRSIDIIRSKDSASITTEDFEIFDGTLAVLIEENFLKPLIPPKGNTDRDFYKVTQAGLNFYNSKFRDILED